VFLNAAGSVLGDLAAWVSDRLAWRRTVAYLAQRSLARVDERGLAMHRLT
jgi:hypothetical protein